jgi:hypothetical protein
MTDEETDKFFADHVAHGSTHVVVAHVMLEDGAERHGVFSSLEKAEAWADEIDEDGDVVFVPYIIDHPEYGNIPAEELQ